MNLIVDKKREYVIAVLAPRDKASYSTIMAHVIKSIGTVEYQSDRVCHRYMFLHDGVTSGSTGYVIETINKIQPSAKQFETPKEIVYKKVPLDIEMYGRRSHYRWLEQIIELEPDLILAFDSGTDEDDEWSKVVAFAKRKAHNNNIRCDVIKIKKEAKK